MEINQETWAKIIAKAWSDEAFKKELIQNPNQVFEQHGIDVPTNMKVHVQENSDSDCYLTLPKKPQGAFSEEQLASLAAGIGFSDLCHGH